MEKVLRPCSDTPRVVVDLATAERVGAGIRERK